MNPYKTTHVQVLSLLASAFFCLNPQHKAGVSERYRPLNCDLVWASLHKSKAQRSKLHCLINYFDTMGRRLRNPAESMALQVQTVVFHRRVLTTPGEALMERAATCEVRNLNV